MGTAFFQGVLLTSFSSVLVRGKSTGMHCSHMKFGKAEEVKVPLKIILKKQNKTKYQKTQTQQAKRNRVTES